jgi:hypothetical protein
VTRPRIVHVTTVHPRDDIRIFRKECVSLARAGHDVTLVVGDGRGDATVEGVHIADIGAPPPGRLARMRRQPKRALERVRALQPALVQVHDPELLPIAARLAREGVVAVYDAHEDVPRQILTKQWIPEALRPLVSRVFERRENALVGWLDAVVAATPHIARRFASRVRKAVVVANYPEADELAPPAQPRPRERAVCYVGGLMRTRGAFEMVRAIARVPGVTLHLAGRFEDALLETSLQAEPGWAQVTWHGQVGRDAVRDILARSRAGLVTLHPMPSYLDAYPIKLFEYMSAGLPVIASDFPLWRELVGEAGLCVDPLDVEAIAEAIRTLVDDEAAGAAMGRAGRAAVLERFHWAAAERELLALYQRLFAR